MDIAQLREQIVGQSRKFFEATKSSQSFVPGKTYIPVTAKVMDADDMGTLIDASLDLWLTAGRYAREFEREIPKFFNRATSGLLVNSGSSANLVAISSLGSRLMRQVKLRPLEKGDEVITAAAGFPTTVNPIVQSGWKPVFVDVNRRTLNVDLETIQSAKTDRTRAVVLAHTLGNPFQAKELAAWCEREGLYLVEDCCDALGATVGDEPVGSFGHYATLSFYPAHHITMGEGGAVIARDGRLRRVAESMRDWGRDCWCEPGQDNTCGKRFSQTLGELPCGYDHKYTYSSVGYNLKVTDMQAAVGVSQLKKVDRFVEARRKNWQFLFEGLKNSPILSEAFLPVEATPGTSPSWFGFPLHCTDRIDREKVVRTLEEKKVGTRLVFAGNLTRQPAYEGVDYRVHGALPESDFIMKKSFWLGVHPGLTPEMLRYILEQLESVALTARVS